MKEQIEKIKRLLKSNPYIEFAYLFGSQAKGLADYRSDWDIAVYFNKDPKKLPAWTVFSLEAEISRELSKEAQIITLNGLDSPVLIFQIIKDGILLVDNDPERRIVFEAQALSKYHDYQYYLKRQMAGRT
ncbi:MAG: nucleotidyltransferase domain-containing protein [Nitrospirae bacterium]|nr:nucleotidyltransferase domain-containing protein [Nitrospirota bacterium]MCL5978283.1 nucleotidyltransferase domain-containing protein [Nitrospirota bacterium]